ncbi:MAG: hypothetical protein RIS44_1655 [Pseudomonadota bacterium]
MQKSQDCDSCCRGFEPHQPPQVEKRNRPSRAVCHLNLDSAVGHARVGCAAVRWQGVTTLRARAREEKQRRQRAAVQFNRVCSAFTAAVNMVVGRNISIHAVLPADASGQLLNPG